MVRRQHPCSSKLLLLALVNYREIITFVVSHERRAVPVHFYLFMDGSPRFTSDLKRSFATAPSAGPPAYCVVVYKLIVSRVSRGVSSASALERVFTIST